MPNVYEVARVMRVWVNKMQCQICQKRTATIHLTEITEGQRTELHICEHCATEQGIATHSQMSINELLSHLLAVQPSDEEMFGPADKELTCPTCGFTLDDLKRVRRFGCSDCYATFSDEVAQMVRGMHKGTSHIGKVPEGLMAVQFRNQRIEELRSRLEQAITSESYEEAAGIRDEIRNLDEVKL